MELKFFGGSSAIKSLYKTKL